MLRVLLAKDLRRAWRNPVPWLIFLALPMGMTALIGLAFGGGGDSGSIGRIRFGVVDEDQSLLTSILRGAANQDEGGRYLEPVFLDRDAALHQLNANKLSAVLIIPTNFTHDYLSGTTRTRLELVKNPAQSIHPTVLDELMGAVVTALNGMARNFSSEFTTVQSIVDGEGDYHEIATLVERVGDKIHAAGSLLNPPLISYTKEVRGERKAENSSGRKSQPGFDIFAYLLAGLSAMFLLFLANSGMADLPREIRQRTFERYHTLQQQLFPFIAGKAVFTGVMLLICAGIMLGIGGVIFGIHWRQPIALIVLTLGYAGFATGLMAVLVAWIPDERRGGALTNIIAMGFGLAGGCAFPPQQLPTVIREQVSPLLPTYWYAEAIRQLQSGWAEVAWVQISLKLLVVAVCLLVVAAFVFRHRLRSGVRL